MQKIELYYYLFAGMLQRRSFILIGLETVKPAIIFAPQSDDLTKMLRAGAWNTRLLSSSRPRQRPTDSFLTTLKNDFNLFKSVSKDVVHQKCSDAYVLYEQFSRRNEVREAREKVSKIRVNTYFFRIFSDSFIL